MAAALYNREHAHPRGIYLAAAEGFAGMSWGDPVGFIGGPTALLQYKPNAAPGVLWSDDANNALYTIGMRYHDVVHFTPGSYEHERAIHPVTGEEVFYPWGLGGKFNTHNPYQQQYLDPAGNYVLDITDDIWYDPAQGLNTTFRSSAIARKFNARGRHAPRARGTMCGRAPRLDSAPNSRGRAP